MGYRSIGRTSDSGSDNQGSSPCSPATAKVCPHRLAGPGQRPFTPSTAVQIRLGTPTLSIMKNAKTHNFLAFFCLGLQAVEGAEATETENHPLGGWTTKWLYLKNTFSIRRSCSGSRPHRKGVFLWRKNNILHIRNGCAGTILSSLRSIGEK